MILSAIEQFTPQFIKASRILIAYSGGVDSHVLLHAMLALRKQYSLNLEAVHVHHGLLPKADAWSEHCAQVCLALDLPFQCIKVKIKQKKGESLEALARQARYQLFSELMQGDDILVVAHHQNDQAETLMLQLMRGAGLKGLASMPNKACFSKGLILRPFLTVSRNDILSYANSNNLSWVEDISNHDLRFDRNYMRYKIMPLLHDRWPGLGKTFLRAARLSAEANELLEAFGMDDIKQLQDNEKNKLSLEILKSLSEARVKNILRCWILQNGFQVPNEKHIDQIIRNAIHAKRDSAPCVSWDKVEVRRFQEQLFIISQLQLVDHSLRLMWDYQVPLSLPYGLGMLSSQIKLGEGVNPELLSHEMEVRFRQGGEKINLVNRKGSHTLKKLFQEWKIPPWERDRIPLIFHQDELIAIVGYAFASKYQAPKNKQGLVFVLHHQ